VQKAPATRALPACTPIEAGRNDRYLLCWRPSSPSDRGGFSFRGRGRIPIAYPYEGPAGQWSGGFLSPDGETLLAQWTAECEVPFAFFVPARGGTPRLVTGERSIEDAPPSIAHGWTVGGEAIIEVIPGCSEGTPQAQTGSGSSRRRTVSSAVCAQCLNSPEPERLRKGGGGLGRTSEATAAVRMRKCGRRFWPWRSWRC
jgi:hypothetical protein